MTSKKYKFSLVGFWIGIGSTLCNSSHHQWAIGWLSGCFFGELSKWVGDLLMIKDQKSMDLLLLLLALHSSAAAFQAVGYELQGKIIHSAEFSHLLRCANVLSLQMELFIWKMKSNNCIKRRGTSQIPEPSPKFYINALKVVVMGILFQRKSKLPNRFDIWLRKLPTVKRVASSWAESGLEGRWWSMFVIFRLIATWIFLWPLAGAKRLWELRNKGN